MRNKRKSSFKCNHCLISSNDNTRMCSVLEVNLLLSVGLQQSMSSEICVLLFSPIHKGICYIIVYIDVFAKIMGHLKKYQRLLNKESCQHNCHCLLSLQPGNIFASLTPNILNCINGYKRHRKVYAIITIIRAKAQINCSCLDPDSGQNMKK